MKTHHPLTRKCTVCGLVKPLAAFLLSGNTYGDVCAECRARAEQEPEDRGGSISKRLRLDDKAKILAELEQKKQSNDLKELYREDHDKREKISTEKKEKKEITDSSEKKHRAKYLDIRTVLSEEKKLGGEKKASQERQQIESAERAELTSKQGQEGIIQKETIEKVERINKEFDFTTSVYAPAAGLEKTRGMGLQTLRAWLGTSAAGMKVFGEAPLSQKPTQQEQAKQSSNEKKSTQSSQLYQPAPSKEGKLESTGDSLVDRMEKVWGPSKKI